MSRLKAQKVKGFRVYGLESGLKVQPLDPLTPAA